MMVKKFIISVSSQTVMKNICCIPSKPSRKYLYLLNLDVEERIHNNTIATLYMFPIEITKSS